MTTTVAYTILAEEGAFTIQAEPVTPGLYVYEQPATIDVGATCRWRIGHHTGLQVARFRNAEDARAVAVDLIDWVDWTGDSKALAAHIANRPDASEFLRIVEDGRGHLGNCAHIDEDESDWVPYGGHDEDCAYVGGISSRCTCD